MMAVMNHITEFPDLDKLLNATDDEHCPIHSSSRDNETNTPFDPNEFAAMIGLYRQQIKSFGPDYQQRLQLEKQKLSKESEVSFLEDVQQALENLGHTSDFASLSLYSPDLDLDQPSMLKDLLLSPYSGKYSREVNSPEHKNQDIVSYGNSSPCHSSQHNSSVSKPKAKKRSKNFPELLKHMEPAKDTSAGNKHKNKLVGTRLVSSKQYLNRYGASHESAPMIPGKAVEPASKRVMVDPVDVAGKKGSARQTLTLTLKSSTAAKILDGKAKDASDSGVAQEAGIGTDAGSSKDPTNHGSVKRSLSAGEPVPAKKVCLDVSPVDHDYCTGPASSASTPSPRQDDRAAKDQDKPVQKVPWQRYLHRQRSGVQSAPVSPSTPASKKNLVKKPTNFMVVSLQNGAAPAKTAVNTVVTKGVSQDTVPVPLPLQKSAVKTSHRIKTFDDYMAELQDNLKSPKPTAPAQNNPPTNYMVCKDARSSASQSLAAIAQKHQRKSVGSSSSSSTKVATAVSPIKCPGQPGQLLTVKVPVSSPAKSGKAVTCTSTVSRVAGPSRPRVGTAAKHVPGQSQHHINTGSHHIRASPGVDSTQKSDSKVTSAKAMNNQYGGLTEGGSSATDSPGISDNKPMSVMFCDDVQRGAKLSPPRNEKEAKVPVASPTFKLMASDRDGGRGKSLILSNVGGQLKDLLTQLAEQQAKLKQEGRHADMDNDQQQIKILRDLIACLMAKAGTGEDAQSRQTASVPGQMPDSKPQKTSAILTNGFQNTGGESVDFVSPENATVVSGPSQSHTDLGFVNGGFHQSAANGEVSVGYNAENAGCVVNQDQALMVNQEQTGVNSIGQSFIDLVPVDDDPAVITLEDALLRLDEDEDPGNCQSNQPGDANVAGDENLFCKLPSYFLNGKLVNEEKSNESQLKNKATKIDSNDPSIDGKSEAELEFNKLPHYLSSGKTSHERSKSSDSNSSKKKTKSKEYAVKLSHITDDQHLTEQGTPVDTTQTYYSRLPSYYSYGRPHPPVKTFNDDAADAKDDTVTQQTLQSDSEREKRRKKKKSKKKKKRKTKRDDKSASDETSEKILYSKLPSYYMSSKVLKGRRKNGRAASPRWTPDRSRSRSYSPRSYRSRSRSRSSCRNTRSRKRYRSRSYSSRSPSYSSGSDSGSRRSWRRERRPGRSRRSGSRDRRSYDTSDEDRDDYRWRRERETRRSKRPRRDNHQKENHETKEERKVVYVGGIEDEMTKQELRSMFVQFGEIEKVSLFFRNDRDNYGFVTFRHGCDAIDAIDLGAKMAAIGGRYDLCFGGRRQFCRSRYEDLDSKVPQGKAAEMDDFDAMLERAQRGLRH